MRTAVIFGKVEFSKSPCIWILILCFLFALGIGRGEEDVSRIALGSCANEKRKQPVWESILAEKPELFLFLGDNVYADTEDEATMRAAYEMLGKKPGYQQLKKQCPILAIWDDHDYGVNDGGKEYPQKEMAERAFHDFFETPDDAASRSRPGIYDVRYFGELEKENRLQVIMLDTRYFRDELVALPARLPSGLYDRNTDPAATILGGDQWDWLSETLSQPANLRVIMTSIQLIPEEHRWELWANFPRERTKFLNLLKTKNTGPVILVSGDRHMGEISELKVSDPRSPGFPVYELTSSGLTNAGGGQRNELNRHRVSSTNFQSINFGIIEIDWKQKQASLQLRDRDGKKVESFLASFAH